MDQERRGFLQDSARLALECRRRCSPAPTSSNESPPVHHATRWRGSLVAAGGALAANEAPDHRVKPLRE